MGRFVRDECVMSVWRLEMNLCRDSVRFRGIIGYTLSHRRKGN